MTDDEDLGPERYIDAKWMLPLLAGFAAGLAGIEYGEGFDELAPRRGRVEPPAPQGNKLSRVKEARKALKKANLTVVEFVTTHWNVAGKAHFWPTTGRWKFCDGSKSGSGVKGLVAALIAEGER